MSLFGKKGSSDDSEAARQIAIKQLLNRELSVGIKKLQRDHISSDSAIRSGDTANRICNVLEAIFLHELKDSYASKITSWSSYLATAGSDDKTVPPLPSSFWLFVMKFTHKDVVQQIKDLSLINTEVGYCRAWIRMGVNDCLMDSYVDAMLSDAKTIRTFYKRTSFLRDAEQPHIMKNYLQGLGNFAFQLSFNSSVLNIWGAAPMIAAGSWAPPRDSPVSEPGTPRSVIPGGLTGLKHQYSDPTSTYTAPKTKQDSSSSLPEPEMEVPRPIEGSFHECEISSTLLHSPSDDDTPLVIPVAMDTDSKNRASPQKGKQTKQDQERALQNVSQQEATGDKESIYGQPEQITTEQSVRKTKYQMKREEFGSGFDESEGRRELDVTEDFIDSNLTKTGTEGDQDIKEQSDISHASNEPVLGNPFLETPATNPFGASSDGNRFDGLSDTDLIEGNPFVESSKENDITTQPPESTNPFDESTEQDPFDEPVDAGSTKRVADVNTEDRDNTSRNKKSNLERRKIPFALARTGAPPVASLATAAVTRDEEDEFRNEENNRQEELHESFQGNSLGARSGWSSSFEHQANTPTTPDSALSITSPTSKSALASYKSLLEDYASQGSTVGSIPTATTLEDLLGQMPNTDQDKTIATKKEGRLPSSISDGDISLEYEVIPFSSSPTSKYADTRTQGLLNMVTVIGREKGLDSQNYQCKGCSRPVGIIYGKANVCAYDGGYYCYECHTDDEAIIPAKILYSWDFRKHKVSKHTKVFLQQIEQMPLIDIEQCNSSLYKAIPELADIMVLRSQLKYLKAYLFTCQQSVAENMRKKVWPREYMLEHMHLYSVQDFLQIQGGSLAHFLKHVIVFAAKHVQKCALCSQKGFICEICDSEKVIYPFDVELTVRCDKCTTVFHKTCKAEAMPCPKCERRRLRKGHPQFHGSQEQVDFATPFT